MARSFKSRGPSPFLQNQEEVAKTLSTPFLRDSRFKHTFEADIAQIIPDPDQSRKIFNEADLSDLAHSIEARGLLQPILVRVNPGQPHEWIIVAGERRWRAVKMLGWSLIPAIEYEGDHVSANLIENLLREDLSAVEEARGIKSLMEHNSWSQSEVARQLTLSQPRVNRLVRILELPEEFLSEAAEKNVPANTLVAISREADHSVKKNMMLRALAGELTVASANAARSVPQNRGSKATKTAQASAPISKTVKVAKSLLKNIESSDSGPVEITDTERHILEKTREAIDKILRGK